MQTQQQSFQATAPLVAGDPTAVSFCPTLLDTSFSLHKAPEVTSHALLTGVTSANRAAVVIKLLELIERDNPKLVWVTDDGSLAGIAAASGMPYLNLDPAGAGFCLNPFWLPLDRREGVRYRPSPDETLSMAMVVALMLDEVGYQPEPEHVSALVPLLFKAVNRSYSVNHAGTPGKEVTFTDFVTNLNSIQVSGLEGEAIGKLHHLVEPVRHVDDAGPRRAQPADHGEQTLRFLGRQRRRRLVHHIETGRRATVDAGILNGGGDLDQHLVAHREAGHLAFRRDVIDAEPGQHG